MATARYLVALWGVALLGCSPPELRTADDRPVMPASLADGPAASDPPAARHDAAAIADAAMDAPPACQPGARRRPGTACGCNLECESGFCTDNVCCNVACNEPCASCRLPDRLGACTSVPAGSPDPRGLCTREAPETCGRSGLCGASGCARYAPGTNCRPPACVGSHMVYPYCDADGTCTNGSPIACMPSVCADGACQLRCRSDADCTPGNRCVDGSCGARGLGQGCERAGQCDSGFCVDGVCCDLPCKDRCWSCALNGTRGRCTAVPADAVDPRAAAGNSDTAMVCLDQGKASCGMNGRCDGAGGCQRYPAGTPCRGDRCDASTQQWTPGAVCEAGACSAPPSRGCAPFRCDPGGQRCAAGCASNADCQPPSVCRDGSCGKKIPGSVCASGEECSTGHCAQGLCCNTACQEGCHACNLPRTLGICTAVPEGGVDPTGTCQDQGPRGCGTDGTCDGSGRCRKYGRETVCQPQTCSKGVKTASAFCDGGGTCLVPTKLACAPYLCNAAGTDCLASCRIGGIGECQPPAVCNDKRCGLAGRGQACAASTDCAGGLPCVDGVCCQHACAGPCKTCKRTPGTCTDVAAGTRDSSCAIDPGRPCGNTGLCDAHGACAQAGSTITCRAPTCASASTATAAALCDGKGTCPPPAPLDCGDNRCTAGTCVKCTSDADCLPGTTCGVAAGLCAAPPQPDAAVAEDAAPDAAPEDAALAPPDAEVPDAP